MENNMLSMSYMHDIFNQKSGKRRSLASASTKQTVSMDLQTPRSALVPTLTRANYYSVPSLDALAEMPSSQLRAVRGLRVGREGYGEVTWLGETDVTGVDLDQVVTIDHGDVTIYGDVTKPTIGTKLNKPAVIVLERVFVPKTMSTDEFIAALGKSLEAAGASAFDYDDDEGLLEFMVPHF